jgi:hypothetical protein
MHCNASGRPAEVILEATIVRLPGSKFLQPGDPLVQPQGVVCYYNKSLLKRWAFKLKKRYGKE